MFRNLKSQVGHRQGFSLVEIMVVLVVTGIMVAGMVNFFGRQQRMLVGQKMVADVQSLGTIGFFLIGRDIRRAGSNPEGPFGATSPVPIPFQSASIDDIEILADLNGDQDTNDAGEYIHYYYTDTDSDGVKDTIKRDDTNDLTSNGNITIQNVSQFQLLYYLTDNTTTTAPTVPYSNITRIDVTVGVTSNRANPATGQLITRTFTLPARLENFN
jgi:prepilin-type N-terminal cleavage/methylation domain-containing protein